MSLLVIMVEVTEMTTGVTMGVIMVMDIEEKGLQIMMMDMEKVMMITRRMNTATRSRIYKLKIKVSTP